MPSYVNPEKCDGCKGGDRTVCMYICPNDLMILDPEAMKAYNQEPDQCWECYSCVKSCPQGAIAIRHYADFAGTTDIMWTIKFRNGVVLRFKFPIRTTPEGSADPTVGKPAPDPSKLSTNQLFTQAADGIEPKKPEAVLNKKFEVGALGKVAKY
jgi:adenylylsulfate reductase subunit B